MSKQSNPYPQMRNGKTICWWSLERLNYNLTVLRKYQMLFASRVSTTSTRSLIRYAIFYQTGPPCRVDCLAPLWELGVKCLFKNTTLYCPIQDPTTLQLPACALIHWAAPPLWLSLLRTQQRVMPCLDIELAILRLLFGALSDWATSLPNLT